MREITALLALASLAFACSGLPELRRNEAVSHDPRTAHDEADTNDDGYVDVGEFNHRITEVYYHGDRDKDGSMTPAELDRVVVFQEDWTLVDSDQDGEISLHEFVRDRMVDFGEVDTDADGLLSEEEVVEAFEVPAE